MKPRFRFWQLSFLLIGACILVLAGVVLLQRRSSSKVEWLFRRLPVERALVVGIDVKSLRQAGLLEQLAGSGVTREPDYTEFVELTGFDYQQDLDYVAVAWSSERRDILARGRFQWQQLAAYATSRAGRCLNMFCDIDGSIPGRKISFFPAAPDVVALSVAQFPGAAWSLTDEPEGLRLETIPAQPIWLTMGSDWIDQADSYPAGLRAFVSALRGANRIRIALGASPSGLELTLDAECLSAESAAAIQQRLSAATTLLASMISRQGLRPNPNDLSGVLSAGTFETQGLAVKGRWPVTTAFLTNLTSGTL